MIKNQRGSAIAYIFLAVFLGGLVMISMTRNTSVNVTTQNLQKTKSQLQADISMIQSAIQECIMGYPDAVDLNADGNIDQNDNPNAPYPVYGDLSYGAAGSLVKEIVCPGTQQEILTADTGRFLSILDDPARYQAIYYNETDGSGDGVVQLLIQPAAQSGNWKEIISQLETNDSCLYEVDKTSGTCSDRMCLRYYIKRESCST